MLFNDDIQCSTIFPIFESLTLKQSLTEGECILCQWRGNSLLTGRNQQNEACFDWPSAAVSSDDRQGVNEERADTQKKMEEPEEKIKSQWQQ